MTEIAKFEGDWTAEQIDEGEAPPPSEVIRHAPGAPTPTPENAGLLRLSFHDVVRLAIYALDGRIVPQVYFSRSADGKRGTRAYPARVAATWGSDSDGSDPSNVVVQDFLALSFDEPAVTNYVETASGGWRRTGYDGWTTAFNVTLWKRSFQRAALGFGVGGFLSISVEDDRGSALVIDWLPI
jgi:hypothetical protein